jgi:hypothetical protein
LRLLQRYYKQIFHPVRYKGLTHLDLLKMTTAVDITNAARYFFEEEPREFWTEEQFPCIVAPWDFTWLEFKLPRLTRSGDRLQPISSPVSHMAANILTMPIKEELRTQAIAQDALIHFFEPMAALGQPMTMAPDDADRHGSAIMEALARGLEAH